MIGPPEPHRRADEQREDADGGEREVERARSGRHRRHRDIELFLRCAAGEPCTSALSPGFAAWKASHDLVDRFDRLPVDRHQDVARSDPGALAGRVGRDLGGDDLSGCILHSTPSSSSHQVQRMRDVRDRQAEQRHDDCGWASSRNQADCLAPARIVQISQWTRTSTGSKLAKGVPWSDPAFAP